MWQKKSKLKHLPVLIIICCGWVFTAHKDLHAVACAGMPDEVWAFFKKHQNSLIEQSVSADRRKHTVWYLAWVNGGSPDLEKFTREPNHDRSRLLQMLLELFWGEKLPNRQKQDTLLLLQ